jgi:hypothetical protein
MKDMKYLYIKYNNNKRTTTMSDGTNLVHKLDTVAPITNVTATTTLQITTPTELDIMCADKIHANYRQAHRDYLKGIK